MKLDDVIDMNCTSWLMNWESTTKQTSSGPLPRLTKDKFKKIDMHRAKIKS